MNNYSVFSAIFPLLVSFTSFNTHLFSSDCIYVLFCLVLTALLISAGANVQADDKTNWKAKKKKKKVNNVRISGGEKLHLFIFCSVWKFRRLKVKYVSMHIKKPMKDVKLYWNTIERNSNMSNKVVASFQSLEIWEQTVSWSVLKEFFIWLIWWYIFFVLPEAPKLSSPAVLLLLLPTTHNNGSDDQYLFYVVPMLNVAALNVHFWTHCTQ